MAWELTKQEQLEIKIEEILSILGINFLIDPNFQETPIRVAKSLLYQTRGYTEDSKKEIEIAFSKKFPTTYEGMLIQKGIKVFSCCPHHLKDIEYHIDFGIIYQKEALGLSKIYRIIKELAARLVLQEDLTTEIVDTFTNNLKPKGVAIVMQGIHGCMKCRGVEQDIPTITTRLTGPFYEDQKCREEFFSKVK